MNKKPLKVEEDAGTYHIAKPAKKRRPALKVVPKSKPKATLNPAQRLAWMPVISADSTQLISADRDGK